MYRWFRDGTLNACYNAVDRHVITGRELAVRIDDATPRLIVSASRGIEGKRIVEYKPTLDKAIESAQHKPDATIIVQRPRREPKRPAATSTGTS